MKISKKGLHFEGRKEGINAFWKDIYRWVGKRNLWFFIKQICKGIYVEIFK